MHGRCGACEGAPGLWGGPGDTPACDEASLQGCFLLNTPGSNKAGNLGLQASTPSALTASDTRACLRSPKPRRKKIGILCKLFGGKLRFAVRGGSLPMDREQIRLTVRGGGPVAVWTNNWFAPPPAAKRSLKLQASMHLPLRAWKMRYRAVHSPKTRVAKPSVWQLGVEARRPGH